MLAVLCFKLKAPFTFPDSPLPRPSRSSDERFSFGLAVSFGAVGSVLDQRKDPFPFFGGRTSLGLQCFSLFAVPFLASHGLPVHGGGSDAQMHSERASIDPPASTADLDRKGW